MNTSQALNLLKLGLMTNQELRDIRDEIDAEPKETDCYGTNGFCGERHCQTCKQIYDDKTQPE